MNDSRHQRYEAWRTEALRRCRVAVEPSVASRLPETVDVAAIRERLGQPFAGRACTQQEFADRFGFSLATVQDWEHSRRQPDHAARVLLLAIEHDPGAVDAAIQAAIERAAADHDRVVMPVVEVEMPRPSSIPFEVVRIARMLKRKQRDAVSAGG